MGRRRREGAAGNRLDDDARPRCGPPSWSQKSHLREGMFIPDRMLLFPTTLWIKRIEHRKWNRGRNGLHQLGQPVAPSILFPVFHPSYPQSILAGKRNCMRCFHQPSKLRFLRFTLLPLRVKGRKVKSSRFSTLLWFRRSVSKTLSRRA